MRINEQIQASQVRLIDAAGDMLGVVTRAVALQKARDAGLDLAEISPQSDPPVCRILDYGKHKYEEQKKRSELKKKQKIIEVKEIQIRPGIEQHDYLVKLRNAERFLKEGNKVKVTLQFRGREMAHQEHGLSVLERLQADIAEVGKAELAPKLEGKRLMMVLVPKTMA
ncbi:MAG: translation initiation factor IF-3 [Alphaproteobacteria bacterium]